VETEILAPTDPLLAQSTVKGLMKCHLNIRLTGGAANHPCHQMKCCDPASPGGAPDSFLSWNFTTDTAGVDKRQSGSAAFTANPVSPLLRPDSPEPRPPAPITV
jgi:hypothetical protein